MYDYYSCENDCSFDQILQWVSAVCLDPAYMTKRCADVHLDSLLLFPKEMYIDLLDPCALLEIWSTQREVYKGVE